MSVEIFVEKLKGCSLFGVTMTMHTKLLKHVKTKNVRALRTYLICLKLAFPDLKVSDTVDDALMREVRDVVSPYYNPNANWKPGMDKWMIFTKIKEPPEM